MGWTRRVGSGAAAAVMAGLLAGCDPAPSGWRSELVSVRADGTRSGDQASYAGVFSPDGTQVAFGSRATDLTGIADTNRCGFPVARPCTDVFVRDLPSGTTSLVSVNAAGSGTGDGPSSGPVFSPDGTKLAFVSTASNLGPTATTATCPGLLPTFPPTRCDDIYLRDLVTGTTSLVTTNAAGTDSANGNSTGPVFTPDGRALIFTSTASDLVPPTPTARPTCTGAT